MKSIFQLRSMQRQGDGLYTALLIKVFAYLLALRLKAQGVFSKLTITEMGIHVKRDSWVSVMYAEELNSGKSSVTLQRTDRHGSMGQKSSDFQLSL